MERMNIKKTAPFFSVCMPVYNAEAFIERAIKSVIAQDFFDYEFLIIDDGSTDDTGIICDNWAEKDERIKVVHRENKGVFYTRLQLIKSAVGEYILFLDSDDAFTPEAFQTIHDSVVLEESDLVLYDIRNVRSDKMQSCLPLWSNNRLFEDKEEIYKKFLGSPQLNSLVIKAFKRDIVKREVYEAKYKKYSHLQNSEDTLLTIDILENARRISYVHQNLYICYSRENSITTTSNPYRFRERIMVRQVQLAFMERAQLTSPEWKILFANGNLRGVLISSLVEIIRAEINKQEKFTTFKDLANGETLKANLFPYMSYDGLPIKQKIILFLFMKKLYWLLALVK